MCHFERTKLTADLVMELTAHAAKFCDLHKIKDKEEDELKFMLVVCQTLVLTVVANHRHGDELLEKLKESFVDGFADEVVKNMREDLGITTKEGSVH